MEKIRNEASRKMKKPLSPSLSSLLKTLQWLLISLRVKAKVSTMDSKVKCNLTQLLYSLTSLTSFATLFPLRSLFSSYISFRGS